MWDIAGEIVSDYTPSERLWLNWKWLRLNFHLSEEIRLNLPSLGKMLVW